jgi:molybdopterin-guanine dinucleotide biosynthesis adapter protein
VIQFQTPILGFCAYGSGIGKTTLLTQLIPLLISRGLRISVIKHAHHSFDIDHPGKDSFRLREAGAVQMMIGSRYRWALMTERSHIDAQEKEPGLEDLLQHIDGSLADLIVVEGFKNEAIPKIEVFRSALQNPLIAAHDKNVIAVASDGEADTGLPLLDLNNPDEIAGFIQQWMKTQHVNPAISSSHLN